MRFSPSRRNTRLTVARLSPSCRAIRTPVQRWRRSRSIAMTRSSSILRGEGRQQRRQ